MNRLVAPLIFIVFFIVSNVYASANSGIHVGDINYCDISKVAINDYEPEIFQTTNNLLRRTGEESLFCGEAIIVYGRVLDQNCIPVSDAKVYLWQTDCQGKYPYKVLKQDAVDKQLLGKETNLTFVGNGTATTNNKGEFHFVTIYPPHTHEYGPHLNVRVRHFSMGSLQTRLILAGKKVMEPKKDPDLSAIADIAALRGMKIYKFEIVMPGLTNKDY